MWCNIAVKNGNSYFLFFLRKEKRIRLKDHVHVPLCSFPITSILEILPEFEHNGLLWSWNWFFVYSINDNQSLPLIFLTGDSGKVNSNVQLATTEFAASWELLEKSTRKHTVFHHSCFPFFIPGACDWSSSAEVLMSWCVCVILQILTKAF